MTQDPLPAAARRGAEPGAIRAPQRAATAAPWGGPSHAIPALDAVRVLAGLLVVWFHTPGTPEHLVASAGGAIFLVATFGLSSLRQGSEPFATFVARRAGRFLLPFLAWSTLYLAVRFREDPIDTSPWESLWSLSAFCAGFSNHLWYLPFAFGGCVVAWPIVRGTQAVPAGTAITAVAGAGVVLFGLVLWAVGHREWPIPWGQWVCSIPSIFVGVAIARLHMLPDAGARWRFAAAISLGTMLVAAWLLSRGLVVTTVAGAIGGPIACAAFVVRMRSRPWVTWLSRRTLGIYVLHPIVSDAFMKVLGMDVPPLLLFVLGYAGAVAVTEVIRRVPSARWIV